MLTVINSWLKGDSWVKRFCWSQRRTVLLFQQKFCNTFPCWRDKLKTKQTHQTYYFSKNYGGNVVESRKTKKTITGCRWHFRRTFSSYQAFISTTKTWNGGTLPIIVIGMFIDQFSKQTNWSKARTGKCTYRVLWQTMLQKSPTCQTWALTNLSALTTYL